MQIPFHLLGLANKEDSLTAVNLDGNLVHYQNVLSASDKNPTTRQTLHNYLITDIHTFGSHVVYGSENKIFYFDVAAPHDVKTIDGLPNKLNIAGLYSNKHSLYAASLDKFVLRFTVDNGELKY